MCVVREIPYPSADGIHTIFARQWAPAGGVPRAIVQIIHGMTEHVGRYDDFARFLAGQGMLAVGGDHLGHGRTVREGDAWGYFGDADGLRLVMEDIRSLGAQARARHPGIPHHLLGHSMGSFFARYHMLLWPGEADGVILSGTGDIPGPLVGIARKYICRRKRRLGAKAPLPVGLEVFNRRYAPARTEADWLTRDAAAVDAYLADPLCRVPTSYGMASDLLAMLGALADRRALRRMKPETPVYLFAGDRDPVGGSGRGVRRVHDTLRRHGLADVRMKLYPGGRHEMLNEINRDEVYRDVLAWLEEKSA